MGQRWGRRRSSRGRAGNFTLQWRELSGHKPKWERTFASLKIRSILTLSPCPKETGKTQTSGTGFHGDGHWPGPYSTLRAKILMEALPRTVMPRATKGTPCHLCQSSLQMSWWRPRET